MQSRNYEGRVGIGIIGIVAVGNVASIGNGDGVRNRIGASIFGYINIPVATVSVGVSLTGVMLMVMVLLAVSPVPVELPLTP